MTGLLVNYRDNDTITVCEVEHFAIHHYDGTNTDNTLVSIVLIAKDHSTDGILTGRRLIALLIPFRDLNTTLSVAL